MTYVGEVILVMMMFAESTEGRVAAIACINEVFAAVSSAVIVMFSSWSA